LLTPIFILSLFSEHEFGHPIAFFVFIIACITDTYDGYYARKYKLVTPEGMFLDPLADKILVSSAFISFAILEVIECWMVILIIFRDLFVTGLRMAMVRKGLTMVTSKIAKTKTGFQISIIIFILLFIGLKGGPAVSIYLFLKPIFLLSSLNEIYYNIYEIIYYLMFGMTVFTSYTGVSYLYRNRLAIKKFLN